MKNHSRSQSILQGEKTVEPACLLSRLKGDGIIEPIDFHFSRFMGRLAGSDDPDLLLGFALASRSAGGGNVCLDLKQWAKKAVQEDAGKGEGIFCPSLSTWRKILSESPVVGPPHAYRPLILDPHDRLYLYRYWAYENRLVEALQQRWNSNRESFDTPRLKESLDRYFQVRPENGEARQRLAAAVAATSRFCIISGGPGTGKTTTAGKILGILLEMAAPEIPIMKLAAPTGKAAARLADAIVRVKSQLPCGSELLSAIPEEAQTLHRLLGTIPGTPFFRRNEDNPVDADIVVIDEASMVDIALLAKLVTALKKETRLILMGDRDQLASVEAGAVLGDLCGSRRSPSYSRRFIRQMKKLMEKGWDDLDIRAPAPPGPQDHIVYLEHSYRFPPGSPIARFSRAVNDKDCAGALSVARPGADHTVIWREVASPGDLKRSIQATVRRAYRNRPPVETPVKALDRLNRFRILCPVKQGPFGVAEVNRMIENTLLDMGWIKTIGPTGTTEGGSWYVGRPILITRNDYPLDLFNGDMGVVLPDPDGSDEEVAVFFRGGGGKIRKIPPHRLPEHETAFAMTVHKSQGSEFDNVILVLPDTDVPVLSRELIYTAVTRARETVALWGTVEIFQKALHREIRRTSGLKTAIWGDG